ncbi:MAG: Fe-S cluster assembly protein SufB [Ilumatobacter sp.]
MANVERDATMFTLASSDDAAQRSEHWFDTGAVERHSRANDEPEWMTRLRLRSLSLFDEPAISAWFAVDLPGVVLEHLDAAIGTDPDPVDGVVPDRRNSVGSTTLVEVESIERRNRARLREQGVVFCDLATAARDHSRLVERYLGSVVSPGDSPLAALNTALWSRGWFVYVPPGVDVDIPLEVDSTGRSSSTRPFERTLIIAGKGANVRYFGGCSAPVYTKEPLHASVVEIVVEEHASVGCTTIQNWSPNVSNFVTKRARVEAGGRMEWIDANIGSKLTSGAPCLHLAGDGATGAVRSVAYAGAGQHQDTGAQAIHDAPNTSSEFVSRSIVRNGGSAATRGVVRVALGAVGAASRSECRTLVLDEISDATMFPSTQIDEPDASVERDETVSTITAGQLLYLASRGLSETQAAAIIANGFVESITKALPIEYAVEWSRLIELQMFGSVG